MELDIVDILLDNEKLEEEKEIVLETPKWEQKTYNNFDWKYITEKEWIELGKPPTYTGITTNRLLQWKYKTKAYYEVLLEIYRAAISYAKLTKTIGWHSETDEKKLNKCRLEIEDWRISNNISYHELFEVVEVAYTYEYNRKALIKACKNIASIVWEGLPSKEKKQISIEDVAKIPSNDKIELKYVVPTPQEEIMDILSELTSNPTLSATRACNLHPSYKGLRKKRAEKCVQCDAFYSFNKEKGIKETRVRDG